MSGSFLACRHSVRCPQPVVGWTMHCLLAQGKWPVVQNLSGAAWPQTVEHRLSGAACTYTLVGTAPPAGTASSVGAAKRTVVEHPSALELTQWVSPGLSEKAQTVGPARHTPNLLSLALRQAAFAPGQKRTL